MKKFIFTIAAAFVMGVAFTACSKCSHDTEPTTEETKTTQLINADKAYMDSVDSAYMYFETTYVFSGNVDTLTTPDVVELLSVFETVDTAKFDPTVYFAEHKLGETDSTSWDVKKGAFWLEDLDLREYDYKLTVEDAFDALTKANVKKPQTKYCVLRAQLGPKRCNPQFIFGNEKTGMVFVDAVTGNVTTVNPVFVFDKAIRLTSTK